MNSVAVMMSRLNKPVRTDEKLLRKNEFPETTHIQRGDVDRYTCCGRMLIGKHSVSRTTTKVIKLGKTKICWPCLMRWLSD